MDSGPQRGQARARGNRAGLSGMGLGERAVQALVRRRVGPGPLVALSGMDGAGKSTTAIEVERRLRAAGLDARIEWQRLGEQSEALDRIAGPVKRLLKPSSTVAEPLASGRPERAVAANMQRTHRRDPVAWAWTVVVTALTVRQYLRAAAPTRSGAAVVCDRWACDSIVDLEVRYGRHAAAEWLLRAAVPRPDLELLLEIDVETSMRRKPEDQAEAVLSRMQSLYDRAAGMLGVRRVDARRRIDEVLADVDALVDGVAARASVPAPASAR
jgi:thymidylate kinase